MSLMALLILYFYIPTLPNVNTCLDFIKMHAKVRLILHQMVLKVVTFG